MKKLNQSYKFFIVISFIVCAFFLTQGCTKRTCRDVNYIEGVSYRNGKLFTGECITNHLNNTIKSIQNYKNGLDHGEWTFYHENGNIEVKGLFKENKKVGEWKYYYKNGNMKNLQIFNENGNRTGTWIDFDSLGNVIRKVDQ